MKGRIAAILLFAVLLTGCRGNQDEMDRVLFLRQKLQSCSDCSFTTAVTADYGEELYTFTLDCVLDSQGDLRFSVVEPESISGITGVVSDAGGGLTFDDQVLAFPVLADGQITPVSAPWVLMKTLRSGYIRACTTAENGWMVIIDDSYQEDSLQLDIWMDENDLPMAAEILWEGRRVLSLKISNMIIR